MKQRPNSNIKENDRNNVPVSTVLRGKEADALNRLTGDFGITKYRYIRALILSDMADRGYLDGSNIGTKDRETLRELEEG